MFDTTNPWTTGWSGWLRHQALCLRRLEFWIVTLSVYPGIIVGNVPGLHMNDIAASVALIFMVGWPLAILIAAVCALLLTLRRSCGILGPVFAWASTALALWQFPTIFRWL